MAWQEQTENHQLRPRTSSRRNRRNKQRLALSRSAILGTPEKGAVAERRQFPARMVGSTNAQSLGQLISAARHRRAFRAGLVVEME